MTGLLGLPPTGYVAVLHINQVDPADRQASATLRLFLPTLDAVDIVDESNGQKVFKSVIPDHNPDKIPAGQPALVITDPQWKDAQLGVTITTTGQIWHDQVPLQSLGYLPVVAYQTTGPLPNDEALSDDGTLLPQAQLQLTLNLAGNPADYPDDQYVLTAGVMISLPRGLGEDLGGNSFQEEYDPSLAAVGSAGLPFRLQSTGESVGGLTVVLGRRLETKFLVWLVALAPLLLLAAGLGTFRRRPAALDFATAAALLAILPLRQVLVPSDVGGFTRIDALLAGEVVTFITVAVWVHLRTAGSAADADGADKASQSQRKRQDEIIAAVATGVTNGIAENLNRLVKIEAQRTLHSRHPLNQRGLRVVGSPRYRRRPRTVTISGKRTATRRKPDSS